MTLTQKPRSRRTVRKTAGRLLLFLTVLYLVPLVVLSVFQRKLIFNASYSRAWGAAGKSALPSGARKITFPTAEGDTITAYYGQALLSNGEPDPNFAHRPTLLFFYGKGGSWEGCRAWFQDFRRLDANVLMPDYAGFGQSSGEESEANCYATADAAYGWLRGRRDVDQKSLIIAGYSLGSGVAVNLAAREIAEHQPVAGLALFAAYTSIADEGHQEYPIYPTALLRLLVKYKFASEQKLPQVTCPVLIVHSRADHLIPYWMSDRLAAASGGPVTRLTITHADHAYYFQTEGKTVFSALGRFLEKVTSPHEKHSP